MIKKVSVLAAVLAVGLTACGTTEDPEPAAQESSAAAQPVSATDSRGKKIDLPVPATKVVVLEWGAQESLASLGVMPVGAADVKGYGTWVSAVKMDPSVKDVGTRQEVNVDAVVALDPDLVIATNDRADNVIAQLEKSVPVLVLRGSSATDPIGQMRTNLELIAALVGKTEQARTEMAEFEKKVADGKKALADAGKGGAKYTMADGYKQGSTISIRMYGSGSLLGATAEQLGLTNAWADKGDKDYGLSQTDVEGLTKVGKADFFYIASDADGGDVFGADLSKNAIWKGLPFVTDNTVHRLPDGIWMFGGPRSTGQFVDAAVEALTT